MIKSKQDFSDIKNGVIVSDAFPDVIEPITAFRASAGGLLRLNRKQFGECVRFAYSNPELWSLELNVFVVGNVCEWRTYSQCTETEPKFIELLDKVCLGGQWIIHPVKGVIKQTHQGDNWNSKMIRLGAHLGREMVMTQHAAEGDYSLRTTAPSIYKLAEIMGATVYYSGKLRDEQIDAQRSVLREFSKEYKRGYVKNAA